MQGTQFYKTLFTSENLFRRTEKLSWTLQIRKLISHQPFNSLELLTVTRQTFTQ